MWNKIPNYEGYDVSDDGVVRSRRWVVGRGRKSISKENEGYRTLASYTRPCGHKSVTLRQYGKSKTRLVHQLVLEAFVGPCPPGHECRHLNGNPADNNLENLEWGTPQENSVDRIVHGNSLRGERHSNHKLSEVEVLKIKASTDGTSALARRYNVSTSTICDIRKGRTWVWL